MVRPQLGEAELVLGWYEPGNGTDTIEAYLREIGKVRLLTAEEEVALAKLVRRGLLARSALGRCRPDPPRQALLWQVVWEGQQAQLKMVEANLRLVVSVAKRYVNQGIPFADLIQEGNLGLLRAVRKYDYRLKNRLSTYATCWIRQAISRAVAEYGRGVRLPAHVAEAFSALRTVERLLQQRLGRDPTLDELALESRMLSADERARIRALSEQGQPLPARLLGRYCRARRKVQLLLDSRREPLSLEAPLGGDEGGTLADLVASPEGRSPADEVLARANRESVIASLSCLSSREHTVLCHRFGLYGATPMTLGQLGIKLGITRERVRQIEHEALHKLRLSERSRGLLSGLCPDSAPI